MEEKKTNCGVYEIVNLIPNEETGICKVYVGSSRNFKSRKYEHFRLLKNNTHSNTHLQRVYNILKEKYTTVDSLHKCFKFTPIKYIEKYEDEKRLQKELEEWEDYYLNGYKDEKGNIDHNRCYNLNPTARNCSGIKRSKETIEKMRKASTGRMHTIEAKKKVSMNNTKATSREIVNLDTNEIFKSAVEASKYYNLNSLRKSICGVCRGSRKTAGGYRWSYTSSKDLTHNHTERVRNKLGKKVINLDTEKEFNNMVEAAEYYNMSKSHISEVCRGKTEKAGGYRWSYTD